MSETTKENVQENAQTVYLPSKVYEFYKMNSEAVPQKTTVAKSSSPEAVSQESVSEAAPQEALPKEESIQESSFPESTASEVATQDNQGQKGVQEKRTRGNRTPLLQTKAAQKAGRFFSVVFRKLGRGIAAAFRKLGVIYCRNICTYSNMLLIGAAFLLCITGAFSQASFGILVLLNLLISIFADWKERKRMERVLWAQGGNADANITDGDTTVTESAPSLESDESLEDGMPNEAVERTELPDEIVIPQRKSKLERSLDAYGRRMGAVAGILSLTLFVQAFMFRYESFQSSVISMCSAFVAVMPIGMYLLNHLAGFAGGARCTKQGLKVQEKRAFLRLGEMDALCICDSSLLGESEPAVEMIQGLQNHGVRLVLISEETPELLSEKAKAMGLRGNTESVDASLLRNMEEMRKAVLRHCVIGNATSLQKGIFVNILRESGAMVAVAAKGETDCAAVQNADVSIGFASKESRVSGLSDMYIENGCLVSIARAYAKSRKQNGLLTHLSGLFFMKNVTALLLGVYAVICQVSYPITLSMWTLLSVFTIGIPSVFLFFYGEEKEYREKFLLASLRQALPAALAGSLSVIALLLYGVVFDLGTGETVTATVLLLAVAGFLMLGRICQPISAFDMILMVICVLGFLFCFLFGKPLFGMEQMELRIRMLLILFLIAEESAHRLFCFVTGIRKKEPDKCSEGIL